MAYIKNADIQGNAWVAEGAVVIGNVTVGDESSVWYNAVIRGDMAPVVIGCGSNVQDGVVVHTDKDFPCKVGNSVTVGHNAILHGCTIGHNTVIGMGSIVMNGAKIGEDCIIGAGSLVTEGTEIPDGMLAFGSPARVIRPLTEEEKKHNETSAITYILTKNLQQQ
ncbi:MAG TPA: gamma carbonic anhydrase family protein [Candidatus Anaerobutyricum avicola]|nr:gamma carbonic anhydrase family protein [Candidatus Anaerobutyricum avicola]